MTTYEWHVDSAKSPTEFHRVLERLDSRGYEIVHVDATHMTVTARRNRRFARLEGEIQNILNTLTGMRNELEKLRKTDKEEVKKILSTVLGNRTHPFGQAFEAMLSDDLYKRLSEARDS